MKENTSFILMIVLAVLGISVIGWQYDLIVKMNVQLPDGICRFTIYDRNYVGMRIKVYNMTLPEGSEYSDDCAALKALCLRQNDNSSRFYTTAFDCEWNDEDAECECLAYPANETLAGGMQGLIKSEKNAA